GAPLGRIADDCEALVRVALAVAAAGGPQAAAVPDPRLGAHAPFARQTVRELMQRHAGIEIAGDESAEALRARALAAGIFVGDARAWDDVFFQIFLERVE